MELELRENMYYRTYSGFINKIISIKDYNEREYLLNGFYINKKDTIKKASYNIVDILEKGDYVNGSKVIKIENVENYPDLSSVKIEKSDFRYGVYETVFEKDIKTIVTKEQMEQMAYKVGE